MVDLSVLLLRVRLICRTRFDSHSVSQPSREDVQQVNRLFCSFSLEDYKNAGREAEKRLAALKSSPDLSEFDVKVAKLFQTFTKGQKKPREPEMLGVFEPHQEFLFLETRERLVRYNAKWRLFKQLFEESFEEFCATEMWKDIKIINEQSMIPDLPDVLKSGFEFEKQLLLYSLHLAKHAEKDVIRGEFMLGAKEVCSSNFASMWEGLSALAKRMSGEHGLRRRVGSALRDWLGDATEDLARELENLGLDAKTSLVDTRQMRKEVGS